MSNIICFDVNGTLVEENSWDIFARGDKLIEKEINDVLNRYSSGQLSISGVWSGLVSVLKKTGRAKKDFVSNCWSEANTLKDGAEEIINYLKEKGYKIYLISCSIDILLEGLVEKLKLDGFYAGSHLVFDDLGELEAITSECMRGREFKKEKIIELAEKEKASVEDIIFVGDGDNDVGVFELTKHGIAMGDNERLLDCSWKQIDSLREIKGIL